MQDRKAVQTMLKQIGDFKSEPLTDFSLPENQVAFTTALTKVREQFGQSHPLVIGGQEIYTDAQFTSTNPAHPEQVIGVFSKAGSDLAVQAIEAADAAFASWSRTPATERAAVVLKSAALIARTQARDERVMVFEVARTGWRPTRKTCGGHRFFGVLCPQILKTLNFECTNYPGERDTLHYISLGVGDYPTVEFPLSDPVG